MNTFYGLNLTKSISLQVGKGTLVIGTRDIMVLFFGIRIGSGPLTLWDLGDPLGYGTWERDRALYSCVECTLLWCTLYSALV